MSNQFKTSTLSKLEGSITTSQKYLATQLEAGRAIHQVNYKMVSKIEFKDNGEVINIKTIKALRKKGLSIEWGIKN